MSEYKVISANEIEELVEDVNYYLAQGWEAVGAMTATRYTIDNGYNNEYSVYYQPIILKKKLPWWSKGLL